MVTARRCLLSTQALHTTPTRTYSETILKPLQFKAKTQFPDKFQGVSLHYADLNSFQMLSRS